MYIQKPKLTGIYSSLRPYLSEDLRTKEEREETREQMKRRFGQHKTKREQIAMHSRIVYPFEWLFMRNPESMDKFIRIFRKRRDIWPKNKYQQFVHKFSDQK